MAGRSRSPRCAKSSVCGRVSAPSPRSIRRRDRPRGFAPEIMAAHLVVSLCCGGVRLADAEHLHADKGLRRTLGVTHFADQTQLGECLRGLGAEGLGALRRVPR